LKLRNEILNALGNDENLSYDKLLELPYLNQVFYEVMRLHPPLVFTSRWCDSDWQYEGYDGKMMTIRKDTPIWIPIPSIQRDPDHFPDPDRFYPERFDAEFGGVKAFKDRMVLIPFGDGPRIVSELELEFYNIYKFYNFFLI
jgi:cytochrome P450